MDRLIKIFLILFCISCTDKTKDQDKWTKLEESRQTELKQLRQKYNIQYELDKLNFKYSIQYNEVIQTEAQIIANGFRLIDIYQKDDSTYISLAAGVPRKFYTLSLSKADLKSLMQDSIQIYYSDKILVVKLDQIRKIDLNTKIFPNEHDNYEIQLDIGRDFIGKGRIIEMVQLYNK